LLFLLVRERLAGYLKEKVKVLVGDPQIPSQYLSPKSQTANLMRVYLLSFRTFCLQSLPALGSFLMSWRFVSGGQRIGASGSASVLPVNIQD